ncbi:MAG: hypothetical protein ACKO14_00335 [Armatimonadota bacterium]
MRFDLLSGIRKWRLFGVLALMLVAIAGIATTVHALQHVICATAATINPGDSEVCGLCHLEITFSSEPNLTTGVALTGLPAYRCPSVAIFRAHRNAFVSHSLRGPPVAA